MEVEMRQKEQRYKLKRETLLGNILIAAFFWCFLGGALFILGAEASAFLQAKDPDPFIFILGRMMLILVVLIGITFLTPKQPFILLTGYEGWPEGSLKDALKKHAPKLFKTSSNRKSAGTGVVGVGAFSGTFRGLKLVPSKWRPLVSPTSA